MPAQIKAPPAPLPAAELLQYLKPHRVLVCSQCQYAIQPDAIGRHLKEIHRIHRDQKRLYLQHAAKFQLAEVVDVMDTPVHGFPVPQLPVIEGFLCAYDGCDHLCASSKRMRNHWSLAHGRFAQAEGDWHTVPMQTFFRGNLLRYFTDPRLGSHSPKPSACRKQLLAIEISITTTHDGNQSAKSFNSTDLSLLQHYIEHTSLTIATDERTKDLWRDTIPRIAGQFEFLMHGVLACSALHLAHLGGEDREFNNERAVKHFDSAFPLYREAITHPNTESAGAILAFAHLLVINSFALQDENEELLLARKDAVDSFPAWLFFIRNGCSTLCDLWMPLARGPLKDLVVEWEHRATFVEPDVKSRWVRHLMELVPEPESEHAWSDSICGVYEEAAVSLAHALACSAKGMTSSFTVWFVIRLWPVHLSDAFIGLLGSSHPAALILVAHYCILLQRLETNWYFKNRAVTLLRTIQRRLGWGWQRCLTTPFQEMGLWPTALAS